MRHRIVRATVLLALVAGTTLAYAYSTGPPPSKTGAPGISAFPAEGLCTQCHSGLPVNDPNGLLEVLDLPPSYVPGALYPLRVRLAFDHVTVGDSEYPYWGFQIVAIQASTGRTVGSFLLADTLKSVWGTTFPFTSREYAEHTIAAIHEGEMGPVEWNLQWTAPPGDSGAVIFCVAGNAANGNGSFTGDHIYTASDTVQGGGAPTAVTPPRLAYRTMLGTPYPNPMCICTDIQFTLARSGHMDLSIYDPQGRRVRTLMHGWREAGPAAAFWNAKRDDGRLAPDGVYFVRLRAEGMANQQVKKITLTH